MNLTDEQKENMKKKRLLIYEAKIFELNMDHVAALAVGDENAAEDIMKEINKLWQAHAAVEKIVR